MKSFFYCLAVIALIGCKPAEQVVEAITQEITEPVSLTFSGDLGEITVGSAPVPLTLTIKNNSSEPITNMKLDIGTQLSVFNYAPDSSGVAQNPGYEGTCAEKLDSKESCVYKLIFNPRKSGKYLIPIIFDYQNLIKAEQKKTSLSVLTGEPAALVYTNDITKYDFGVIEQTDATEKILDMEIKNIGGLTAKNTTFSMNNGDPFEPAFRVVENNCPENIKTAEVCTLKIGYKPFNNNYTDPETKYNAKMVISFEKDSSGKTDKLNSFFAFTSSTIEAKFTTNFAPIDFGKITAGTKLTRSIKISNTGYNTGYLQSFNFINSLGAIVATCSRIGTNPVLECNQTLDQFPFLIEDKSNCWDRPVKGVSGTVAGDSCFFDVTYWPSKKFLSGMQAFNNFDNANLSLTYDSQWKNEYNQVTKNNMFQVKADYIGNADMRVMEVAVENIALPPDKMFTVDGKMWKANLGRLAKVADPSMETYIKITLKNFGESPASLDSLQDGSIPAKLITDAGYDLNSYYKAIKHNSCAYVAPGATCNFSFNLIPLLQATPAQEDTLMYDNISDPMEKYKAFYFIYKDGSEFEDNGLAAANSQVELRMISKLIAKGMLAFVEPLSYPVTTVMNGSSITKFINLKNVGTGDIYAISYHGTNNLFPRSSSHSWPYRIVSAGTLPAGVKDCKDILYTAGQPTTAATPDTSKFLEPGKTCTLAFEVKAANVLRLNNAAFTTYVNHTRLFGTNINNTEDIWPRTYGSQPTQLLSFNYYDGDVNADDASSQPFGYLVKTKDMSINSTVNQPPYIIVEAPKPEASGVLGRPELTYPTITQTYPTNYSINGYTIPETWFDNAYFNSGVGNMFLSGAGTVTRVRGLNLIRNDATVYHMGTYKAGSTYYGQFTFSNPTQSATYNTTITEESIVSPLTILSFNNLTAKPFPATTISAGQKIIVKVKFTPSEAGTFTRCFDLTYDNRAGNTWINRVCASADAVAAAPNLKIEEQNIDVTLDGSGNVTESPSNIWTTVTAPLNIPYNHPLNGPDTTSKIVLTSVKGSAAYALKLVRVTNIGDATATKLNYSFMTGPNAIGSLDATASIIQPADSTKRCLTNTTLAAGGYCEFYIKYKPLSNSSNGFSPLISFVYDMGNNFSQFVTQTVSTQFIGVDPAKLVAQIAGASPEAVTDWSNPANPLPQSVSWPLNLQNFSTANTHMVTLNNPTTVTFNGVQINNTSTIKASFLTMNPAPAGTWSPILTNSTVTINANRACFYGDDEFNAAIPANEKGFNATSVAKCQLQVIFSGDYTYQSCSAYNATVKTKTVMMGGRVQATCNPYVYALTFYNYKRLASEKIYIHMKGFIEPPRSVAASTSFSNVQGYSVSGTTGSAKFTWPEITAENTDFGAITKYRIFYSTSINDLKHDNMFYTFQASPVISSTDTSSDLIDTITANNLVQTRYYFFRLAAVRTYNHPVHGPLTYVSMVKNLPILSIPIPKLTEVYVHSMKAYIDKAPLAATGSLTAGQTACTGKKYDFSIQGVAKQSVKSLITTPIWNYITANPSASSGYPNNEPGSIPHWLNDTAYNMKTSISLYDGSTLPGFPNYDYTKLTGNDLDNKIIYSKGCTNSASCDLLNKVVGGDDVDLYYKGTYYTTPTGIAAYHRCWGVILCATNTAKLATDPTCANP